MDCAAECGNWTEGTDCDLKHIMLAHFIQLLLSIEGRRSKADDHAMLSQLESLNPEAGRQFLEHIILQKRNHVW